MGTKRYEARADALSQLMGSGSGVGSPKPEDRPAATATEALAPTVGAFEETVPEDWTGDHCIFCLRSCAGKVCLRTGGSFVVKERTKWLQEAKSQHPSKS